MKKCPYCAEEIQDEAIYCRWCERDLIIDSGETTSVPPTTTTNTPNTYKSMPSHEKKSWSELLFSSKGRISRGTYFGMTMGVPLGVGLIYAMVTLIFPDPSIEDVMLPIFGMLMLVPLTLLVIKRFHDLDKSGWYSILAFIPLINIVVGWILILKSGTKGPNRFGDEP